MSVIEPPVLQARPQKPIATRRMTRWFKRVMVKGAIFGAFALLVLNPNLKRAFLQVGHVLRPDSLIQTQFPGMTVINQKVDQFIAADGGRHNEARLVARF